MKKFKAALSIALLMAMTAGIAGCNVTPAVTSLPSVSTESSETTTEATTTEETTTESETSETTESSEKTSETTEETTTEETTKKPTATPAPVGKTTVNDQYKRALKVNGKKLWTHIPQILIEDVDTDDFNKEVLDKFKDIGE